MDDLELLSNSNPILNIPITTYTDNKTQESLPLPGFLVQHLIATPSSWCLILSFQRVSWRKKGHQSKVTATPSGLGHETSVPLQSPVHTSNCKSRDQRATRVAISLPRRGLTDPLEVLVTHP